MRLHWADVGHHDADRVAIQPRFEHFGERALSERNDDGFLLGGRSRCQRVDEVERRFEVGVTVEGLVEHVVVVGHGVVELQGRQVCHGATVVERACGGGMHREERVAGALRVEAAFVRTHVVVAALAVAVAVGTLVEV